MAHTTTTVALETFDYDHLEGNLHDIGQQFHETMIFLCFNLPQGVNLDASLRYLAVSRERALDAIRGKEESERIAASQLDLDLPGVTDDEIFESFAARYVPET